MAECYIDDDRLPHCSILLEKKRTGDLSNRVAIFKDQRGTGGREKGTLAARKILMDS